MKSCTTTNEDEARETTNDDNDRRFEIGMNVWENARNVIKHLFIKEINVSPHRNNIKRNY
jgi:hypothetical protein